VADLSLTVDSKNVSPRAAVKNVLIKEGLVSPNRKRDMAVSTMEYREDDERRKSESPQDSIVDQGRYCFDLA